MLPENISGGSRIPSPTWWCVPAESSPGAAIDEPTSSQTCEDCSQEETAEQHAKVEQDVKVVTTPIMTNQAMRPPEDWRIVLEEYKTSVVPDVQSALQARSDEAKQIKKRIKELALRINAEKRTIDQLTVTQQAGPNAPVRLQSQLSN